MTKNIRVENADTSDHKVTVSVQDRKWDAETNTLSSEWVTTQTFDLDYPTAMHNIAITSTRRLIVEEKPKAV